MSNHGQDDPRPRFDSAARVRGCRIALFTALLAALAACHAPSPRVTAAHSAPPPSTHEPEDGTYDWHGLLIAPFGSLLKDIPLTLHEVLLFRDEAESTRAVDDAECYAADTPAPRFVGRTPEEFLLCFKQDRLSRIQASVRLAAAEASDVFAVACAGWMKNAPATASAAAQGATAQGAAATVSTACEGHDGTIRFSGRLEKDPSETETDLIVILDSAPVP
jgi:hypothetical protein